MQTKKQNDEENNNSVCVLCVWAQNDFDTHTKCMCSSVSHSNRKRTHLPWMKRDETKQTEPIESKRSKMKSKKRTQKRMCVYACHSFCSVWKRERERERESAKRASVLFISACRIIIVIVIIISIIDTPQKEISCCLPVVRSSPAFSSVLHIVRNGLADMFHSETCSIRIFSMWAKSLAEMLLFWSLLFDWFVQLLCLFTAAVLILLLYS